MTKSMQRVSNNMNIKPIRTEEEYEAVLEEIDALFDAKRGTPEGDQLEILCMLVEAYEDEHYPIPYPDPISAIEYYLETTGTSRAEFSKQIGVQPNRLSELLSKQRELSKAHIRNIHTVTKISAEVLLQPYELAPPKKRLAA